MALFEAVRRGDAGAVERLLEAGTVDVNAADNEGCTALVCAIHCRQAECGSLLAAHPATDPNTRDSIGRCALHWAAESPGMPAGEDPVLLQAVLAMPGVDVNARNAEGHTPLMTAVLFNRWRAVELLLVCGRVDASQGDTRGVTPLMAAARAGSERGVGLLLAAPATRVDSADHEGATALLWAVRMNSLACLRALAAAPGVQVDAATSVGVTPLLAAAGRGRAEAMAALLEAGADPAHRNLAGESAMDLAAARREPAIVKLLWAHQTRRLAELQAEVEAWRGLPPAVTDVVLGLAHAVAAAPCR